MNFDAVEKIVLTDDFTEKMLLQFVGLFGKLKKIKIGTPLQVSVNLKFSDRIYEKIVERFSELEELRISDVHFSASVLDKLLNKCAKLRKLFVFSSGPYHLKVLAQNPNSSRLESLYFFQETKSDHYSEFDKEEREGFLCEFVKRSGANLRVLKLQNCFFLGERTMRQIMKYCPNFCGLKIDNEESFELKFSQIPLSLLTELAYSCPQFPTYLELLSTNDQLACTHDEIENLKKFFYRLKSIRIRSFEDELRNLVDVDCFDPEVIEKIKLAVKKQIPYKNFCEGISRLKKLRKLEIYRAMVDQLEEGEEMKVFLPCMEEMKIVVRGNVSNVQFECPKLKSFRPLTSELIHVSERMEEWTLTSTNNVSDVLERLRPKKLNLPSYTSFALASQFVVSFFRAK